MKKKGVFYFGLVFILLVLVILLSFFVLGGDSALDFKNSCASRGCYIYDCQYPDGPPLDVLSELDSMDESGKCNVKFYCEDDVLKKKITSTKYTGPSSGAYRACVKDLKNSCTYTIETCENTCFDEGDGDARCLPLTCEDYFLDGVCGVGLSDGLGGELDCEESIPENTFCDGANLKCNDGYTKCGDWLDGCFNLMTDVLNCGRCSKKCSEEEICDEGICLEEFIVYNYWMDMLGNRIVETGLGFSVRINSSEEPKYVIFDDDGEIELDEKIWTVSRLDDGNGFNFSTEKGNYAEDLLRVNLDKGRDSMNIEIIEPSCGDDFDLEGDEVSVKIKLNVTDSSDIINGNISVNGDFFKSFDNLNGPIVEFDYVFGEVGNMKVVVDAENSVEKKKVISNIMVYDSDSSDTQYYVASCIDEPKHFELFPTNRVRFNASSSRGIKWDGSNLVDVSLENLLFNWTFELSNGARGTPCVGMGNQDCFGDDVSEDEISVRYFYRYFPTVDNNKAFLKVSIVE